MQHTATTRDPCVQITHYAATLCINTLQHQHAATTNRLKQTATLCDSRVQLILLSTRTSIYYDALYWHYWDSNSTLDIIADITDVTTIHRNINNGSINDSIVVSFWFSPWHDSHIEAIHRFFISVFPFLTSTPPILTVKGPRYSVCLIYVCDMTHACACGM